MSEEESPPEGRPPADPPPERDEPPADSSTDYVFDGSASGESAAGDPHPEAQERHAASGGVGSPNNGADGGSPAEAPLEDADPDENLLADKERDEGEQAAFDTRVDGFRRMFGDTEMTGDRARLYQARFMAFFNGEGSPRPRVGPVSARYMQTLRRTYVCGVSYQELLHGLADCPVQTLVGTRGQGRTTTALAAVAERVAPGSEDLTGKVHIIEVEGQARTFDGSAVPENCGLVLVLDPGESAPGVARTGQIARNLPHGSVLVVVADTMPTGSSALNAENLTRYVMPQLEQVFTSHMNVLVDRSYAAEISAREAVRAELGRCRTPREAAQLALDIAEGWKGGRVPEDVIAARDPADLIKHAHDELIDSRRWLRAFLVVCAVLDGLAAGTVIRERSRFADLMPKNGASEESDRTVLSTKPIGEWSRCVELSSSVGGTGRTVRLLHPRLVSKILEEVWQDHIQLRDALLTWLRTLAVHPDVRVRVKAAQAVAKLATYDFDVIKREVLRAWAGDGGFRTRQAVAWALEALALADGGRFAARVRGLVRDWARSSDVRLQAGGVATYGTFLGSEYPDEALECMRRIAGGRLYRANGQRKGVELAERELANIVQQSIVDVFLAGAHEKVVHELAEWTRMPAWRWRRCAAKCLVRLAGRNGTEPGWPLLMELADRQPGFRADVSLLWRNALASEHDAVAPWDALRRLILLAENADRQWPAAGDTSPLATTMASGGWSAEALRFHTLTRGLLIDIATGDTPADDARVRSLRFHIQLWEFRDGRRLTVVPDSLR